MFDNMYFRKALYIDSKNRIYVPRAAQLEIGTEIAIAKLNDYYALFLLTRINRIVDDLRNERMLHLGKETAAELLKEIDFVFNAIRRVSQVDRANRIILPNEIRNLYGPDIIAMGRKDHIALFSKRGHKAFEDSLLKSKILG